MAEYVGLEQPRTYFVDQYNGKGAGIGGYSFPGDGIRAGACPGCVLPRRSDGICKGRDSKQDNGKQRETEHVVQGVGSWESGKVGRKEGKEGKGLLSV